MTKPFLYNGVDWESSNQLATLGNINYAITTLTTVTYYGLPKGSLAV
jgi:hypothetical protein